MNLVQRLNEHYPLDIIGDVHGELDALKELLQTLGYDEYGNHPNNRKLVFVGDLVDRGPDSVGVVLLVRLMVALGNAQCVLGNHELNILLGLQREGNGWFFGSPHDDDKKPFNYVYASESERKEIILFFQTLPIALVSDRLRIVHACWDENAIKAIESEYTNVEDLFNRYEKQTDDYINSKGLKKSYIAESKKYSRALTNRNEKPPFLPHIANYEICAKIYNHIKTITSGPEKIVDEPYFAGGKWRMLDRDAWWDSYEDDIPVIIGHYWRTMTPQSFGLFQTIKPTEWFGKRNNVFCIDYSVGRRYRDRANNVPFSTKLFALRYPENVLISANSLSVINNSPK